MTREPKHLIVSVDRIEASRAVFEGDDGRAFIVPVRELSTRPREGMLYRVPLDSEGEPLWSQAIIDHAAAELRRNDLEARMKALRDKDPGGDTKL